MSRVKIGVCLASLGVRIRAGLEWAAKHSVGGVQIDATGDLAPEKLSSTGRREFRNLLKSYNLELTAVNCPMRRGLDLADDLDARLDHVRRTMDLAVDLGPRVVIVEAGAVPGSDDEAGSVLRSSLHDLTRYGDRVGVIVAIETGLDTGERTREFLSGFDSGSLGVNFDPANLLLNGHEPTAALMALGPMVVHAHARDARRAGTSRSAREVPVGAGDIEWMGLLATLDAIEYRGWLVVERRSGGDRAGDIAAGLNFLRRFVG